MATPGKPGKRGPKPKDRTLDVPLKGVPKAPTHLDTEARKHWGEVTQLLEASGYLSRLDSDAITLYVSLWSRWRLAEDMVKRQGAVIEAGGEKNKYMQANPWYSISVQCLKDMKAFLGEFGLSPKARLKLTQPEPEEVDDKWQEPE